MAGPKSLVGGLAPTRLMDTGLWDLKLGCGVVGVLHLDLDHDRCWPQGEPTGRKATMTAMVNCCAK